MGNKTILTEVEGFTPLITVMIPDVGLTAAAVFGRVWRYCQGQYGVCQAKQETIAGELGLSRETVNRHIQTLCAKGYLRDLSPGLRNRPHTFADTGRVVIQALLSAQVKTQTKTGGVIESHTEQPFGVIESHSSVILNHSGVIESHMKIEEKREEKTVGEPNTRQPAAANVLTAKELGSGEKTVVDGKDEPLVGEKRDSAPSLPDEHLSYSPSDSAAELAKMGIGEPKRTHLSFTVSPSKARAMAEFAARHPGMGPGWWVRLLEGGEDPHVKGEAVSEERYYISDDGDPNSLRRASAKEVEGMTKVITEGMNYYITLEVAKKKEQQWD